MIPIYQPENSIKLALAESVLEAYGVPYFVHNGGFGSLYPGPQIELYNVRTIMVPEEAVDIARELLAKFIEEGSKEVEEKEVEEKNMMRPSSRFYYIRLIAETLLVGWFIPKAK